MNLATISFAYLKARSLNTLLNILLLALGIATIVLLLLVTTQLDQRMRRDTGDRYSRSAHQVAGAESV